MPKEWFAVDRADFVGLSDEALEMLTETRTWFEMKCLQQIEHGFLRALAQHGVELASGAMVESDTSSGGGYRAAQQLFDTVQPSAIFAANDLMGIGALRAAAERRISVPDDCSIIGFDDIELSRYTYPSLSTVGNSVRAIGEMAAQTLIERIINGTKSSEPVRRRVVAPQLVARESTGPWAGARAPAPLAA